MILTGASLDSGMGWDFRKGSSSLSSALPRNSLSVSRVYSPSSAYLVPSLAKQTTVGTVERSTPMYSASLLQRPCPSSLLECAKRTPLGAVSSSSLKAARASSDSLPVLVNRNKVVAFSLKILSMASLLKGMISADTTARHKATTNRFLIKSMIIWDFQISTRIYRSNKKRSILNLNPITLSLATSLVLFCFKLFLVFLLQILQYFYCNSPSRMILLKLFLNFLCNDYNFLIHFQNSRVSQEYSPGDLPPKPHSQIFQTDTMDPRL